MFLVPPGSPFKAMVIDGGHKMESITHYQGAAAVANVGNVCGINLKIPGTYLFDSWLSAISLVNQTPLEGEAGSQGYSAILCGILKTSHAWAK